MKNRRVQMTKRLLKEALLELLDEKPLEKISVTDVCRRADVNRSTFYAHYMDTTALLHEMEQEVFSELPGADFLPVDVHDQRFFDALESFFTYVRKNERLFRILLVRRESGTFHRTLLHTVMERFQPAGTTIQDRYRYIYCVDGAIGLIKAWIIDGFPLTTHEFAAFTLHTVTDGMKQAEGGPVHPL